MKYKLSKVHKKWCSANNNEDTGGVEQMYIRWKEELWVNKYINIIDKLLCNGHIVYLDKKCRSVV